jgi:hypothetical protein
MDTTLSHTPGISHHEVLKKNLLICGIMSSLYYVALNILVPLFYPGYDVASLTVSELSAIGAPTRALWVWLCSIYTILVVAFGWGVWLAAAGNRLLRISGLLLLIYGALGIFWPFAPMHQRQVLAAGGGTFSDTLHLVFAAVTVLLMILAIGFGAAALSRQFRIYSVITLVVLAVFGALTGLDAARLAADQPTPLTGIWERINIGVFLLWIIILALILLGKEKRANVSL